MLKSGCKFLRLVAERAVGVSLTACGCGGSARPMPIAGCFFLYGIGGILAAISRRLELMACPRSCYWCSAVPLQLNHHVR